MADYKEKSVEEKNTELLNIDYYAMIHVILKKWWMILAVAISCAMLAYMISDIMYTPQYTTKCTMIVTAKGTATNTYASTSASSTSAELFTSVLTSDILKKKVAQSLGDESLYADVAASQVEDTSLIELKVTANDPVYAYKTIVKIKECYPEVSQYILEDAILEDVLSPSIPMKPNDNFDGESWAKKGFIVGAASMMAFIILAMYVRDDIKTKKDAKSKLETSVIGVIYHERKNKRVRAAIKSFFFRKKKSILISNPTVSLEFVEGMKKISFQIEYEAEKKNQNVIMVTSMAENEGKSTTAANLALSLAMKGKKVALLDGDLRRPAQYLIFDIPKEEADGMKKVLEGTAVEKCLYYNKKENIYMLLGNQFYKNISELLMKHYIADAVKWLCEEMDYVIIDTPPIALISDTEIWAEMADASVLVMKTSRAVAVDINEVIAVLEEMNAKAIGCILNDVRTIRHSTGYGGYYGYGYSKYGYHKYYGKYKYYGEYGKYETNVEENEED